MDSRRLARIGEVVVVIALMAGSGYLAKLLYHNYVTHGPSVSDVRTAPKVIPARDGAGERAALAVADSGRPLLLLVMKTTCPYCEENMPNWDALAARLARLGDEAPELVVLSVSPPAETRAYLERHGVEADVRYIDPAVLPLLGLVGYPSTVAIDPSTRSLSVWDGVLADSEQEAILAWAGIVDTAPLATGGVGGD